MSKSGAFGRLSGVPEALLQSNPSLEPPGDKARQAVASLRGYAYQIYASAQAWLDMPPEADLYLEVAEDYAIAIQGALQAVQVKDVQGTVSLASASVRQAISGFVELVNRKRCSEAVLAERGRISAAWLAPNTMA